MGTFEVILRVIAAVIIAAVITLGICLFNFLQSLAIVVVWFVDVFWQASIQT